MDSLTKLALDIRDTRITELEDALTGVLSLCGTPAHSCGCDCGGRYDAESMSCKEGWSAARKAMGKE